MHESSKMDDSWQKHLFTSRDTCTTRDRNNHARVVKGGRLVTDAFVHESWHMHDSSHTQEHPDMHCIHPFPIIHAYFYKLVYYSNNLFIYLLFYSLYCLNSFNFLREKLSFFPRIDMSFHILTHLFTNTYFLHTYKTHSHTLFLITFSFPISSPAQETIFTSLPYSFNPLSYSFIFFIHKTLHLLNFSFTSSLILTPNHFIPTISFFVFFILLK